MTANSFPSEPTVCERRIDNPKRVRLCQDVAMAQPHYDSPHKSSSESTPRSPFSSTGGLSQEGLALQECKVSVSTGGTSTSSLMVDTNEKGLCSNNHHEGSATEAKCICGVGWDCNDTYYSTASRRMHGATIGMPLACCLEYMTAGSNYR